MKPTEIHGDLTAEQSFDIAGEVYWVRSEEEFVDILENKVENGDQIHLTSSVLVTDTEEIVIDNNIKLVGACPSSASGPEANFDGHETTFDRIVANGRVAFRGISGRRFEIDINYQYSSVKGCVFSNVDVSIDADECFYGLNTNQASVTLEEDTTNCTVIEDDRVTVINDGDNTVISGS